MTDLISWPFLLGITIVLFTVLFILRRTFYRFIPRNLQIADSIPLIMMINIHVISYQVTGWSIFPYLMLTWLILMLAYVIYRGFWINNFNFKGVFLTYWRLTVIVLPIVYVIFLVMALIKIV